MAPSGKTYSTAPSTSLAMGLSTNFGATPTILRSFSTVRPRRRSRGRSRVLPIRPRAATRRGRGGSAGRAGRERPARPPRHRSGRWAGPSGARGLRAQRNARRNRRFAVESADVATCDLKTSIPWPLRARPTIRGAPHGPLRGYPRASPTGGPFWGGYPPFAHRAAIGVRTPRGCGDRPGARRAPGSKTHQVAASGDGRDARWPGRAVSPTESPWCRPCPTPGSPPPESRCPPGTTKRPKEPLGPSVRLR